MEKLLTLEAKYGPISGHDPAINDVIDYLSEVLALQNNSENHMQWYTNKTAYLSTVNWFNK